MKIYIAQLNPTIGAFEANTSKVLEALDLARKKQCDLVLFSELTLCGYPPEDLLLLGSFVDACDTALKRVVKGSKGLSVIVGLVRRGTGEKPLHNSAAVIEDGKLLGFVDKSRLPTYDVFDERRYFEPSKSCQVWNLQGKRVAISICEDIWGSEEPIVFADYERDPIGDLEKEKPDLHLNLSASPYSYGKFPLRFEALARSSRRLNTLSIFCNQVGGNDSLIFDGHSFVVDPTGACLVRAKGFEEDGVVVNTEELPSPISLDGDPLAELYSALVMGVRDYFTKSGFKKACLGLSGGIDSSLVACIGVDALGSENVLGLIMPSPFSSEHSMRDAKGLAKNLNLETITLPIDTLYHTYLDTLTPHFQGKSPDATEENLQARIRGMLLMAISNKQGHIVLSTGNKSESAMGYATLYGDMCGGLAVINDVPKLKVYELCRYLNREGERIPNDVLEKPPSAELAPDQKDSDTLPPYAIVDAVLEDYVQYHMDPKDIAKKRKLDLPLVEDLVERIHRNEYKRRQSPPGLRVTEKAFSVGRRFPIVQKWT